MGPMFFLLLPTLAYGEIAIFVGFKTEPPLVNIHGYSSNLITEKQRETFNINDEQLKNAIANYSKETPTDVFLKRESRFNLHKEYKWSELNRTVRGRIAHVSNINCEKRNWTLPQGFVNILNEFNDNTVFLTDNISVTVDHEYDTANLNFSWGDTKSSNTKFAVPFKPAQLSKCSITFDIELVAKLHGDVVVNYSQKRKGHYFWAFDIKQVQRFNGMPETEVRHAKITIRYGKPLVGAVDGTST